MGYQYFERLATQWMEDRPGRRWESDVVRAVKQPLSGYNKEDMPLWAFYELRPDAERNSRNCVRAHGKSVKKLLAFIVDYDSGVSPWEVHESMKQWTHVIYTSPGHTAAKSKFRMIVPLAVPLVNAHLLNACARDHFVKQFPGCDPTTFDAFRRQRVPHVPLDQGAKYEYYVHSAEFYAVDESLIPEPPEDTRLNGGAMFGFERTAMRDALLKRYADELADYDWGNRGGGVLHYALKRMAYALAQCGMSAGSIQGFLRKHSSPGMYPEISQLTRWATSK
jgi:hypothetical protein